jgi:MFS transporter, OFA family, oxalate/formate antiporter
MEAAAIPFGDFLDQLKQQGFSIGVDHYLRLQTVLNLIGPDCLPEDLKKILCPIFAVNPRQQQLFNQIFDRYFPFLAPTPLREDKAIRQPSGPPGPEAPGKVEEEVQLPVVRRWPYITAGLLVLLLVGMFFVSLLPPVPTIAPTAFQTKTFAPSTNSNTFSWLYYCRYVLIFLPLVIFLMVELFWRWEKQPARLARERGQKPPFVSPITCLQPELGFLKDEEFYAATRRLKRRQPTDVLQLDINATINHTIQSGGFPSFRYKAITKIPEYFILIDLPTVRDHYGRLVAQIVDAMRSEGNFITRYFYDRDPRRCFADYFSERVLLKDLQGRFSDCRLIIFGDCEKFLHPVTGELEKWVNIFETWSDRIILTPLRRDQWSMREKILSQEFLLQPATVDGLAAVGEFFSGFPPGEADDESSPLKRLLSEEEESVDSLKDCLGKDVFQWLCACACHPLNYDLTLHLAGLSCMPPGLLTERSVLSLFRLPWFRNGSIPEDKRLELQSRLDPDKQQVYRAIKEVLEQNKPDSGTFARNTQEMYIKLQEYLLSPKERRDLREFTRLPETVGERAILEDHFVLKHLESAARLPFNLPLPPALHPYLFRRGRPFNGFKSAVRGALAVLAAGALYILTTWPRAWIFLPAFLALPAIYYLLKQSRLASVKKEAFIKEKAGEAETAPPKPGVPGLTRAPGSEKRPDERVKAPVSPEKPIIVEGGAIQTASASRARAWVVVFAGSAINLCLGILYAWSVWAKALINPAMAGEPMKGLNAGWSYLTNAEAATPFSLCVLIFALFMIPGGRIQDKFGPKVGAISGGLFLGLGCIIVGVSKSYAGLILGFGLLGGIGMGLGYAASLPTALKWFGPHKYGLAAGLVVGGYGAAALYISPLASYLINAGGISYSFIWLGIFFAVVIIAAGSLLACPPADYAPEKLPSSGSAGQIPGTASDKTAGEMLKTRQFYALVFMLSGTTLSGLLIIANIAGILAKTAKGVPFLAVNAWILVSFGSAANALGRVMTGLYADKLGRSNAFSLNSLISALFLFLMPWIATSGEIALLFLAVGLGYWQYGGGLALMPAYTADLYGTKNLGLNYGLVYIGWGLGFFIVRLSGIIKDATGSLDMAYWWSAAIFLILGVIVCRRVKRFIPHPALAVTEHDLILNIESWRDSKSDERFEGRKMYRWNATIQGRQEVLEAIESVTYRLHQSYPDPVRKVLDRSNNFKLKELAWGSSTLYADIKVRHQDEIITVSEIIRLQTEGRRTKGMTADAPASEEKPETKTREEAKTRRLKKFKILTHPTGETQAVKQGWSWPAFFFTGIWLLLKRSYFLGIMVIFYQSFLLSIKTVVPTFFVLIDQIIARFSDTLLFMALASAIFGVNFFLGRYGNYWWEKKLLQRGYTFKETMSAANDFDARFLYTTQKISSPKSQK